VFADPGLVEDPLAAARELAPILDLSEDELLRKLRLERRFVWLGRQVDPAISNRIKELGIRGVRCTAEAHRTYPNGQLAGQLLGFAGIDGNGLEGLESRYDEILMGEKETYVALRDGRRRNITPQGIVVKRSTEGQSITLTIDRQIQFITEQALARAVEAYTPRGAFAIVLDPDNGDILALANAPILDPNRFTEYERDTFRNRAVADSFEPGSIMKPFLMASALDSGVIQPGEEFDCEHGSMRIGRNTIHDTHPYDQITVEEILQVSSNIGSAKIAQRMGAETLHDAFRRCGFGRTSGVDLAGESGGILRGWKSWRRIGLATHAFGQGVSVTGLQLASALGAIANGGTLYKPRVILEMVDRQGQVVDTREPTVVDRPFGAAAADAVRRMMGLVVIEGGTGTRARLEHYTSGGKTGTAQKVNSETGRYDRTMWVSSFIGFAPLEDPELVIVVVVDEPQGKHYGGTVSGPVFKEIASRSLQTMGLPPMPSWMVNGEDPDELMEGDALVDGAGDGAPRADADTGEPGATDIASEAPAASADAGQDEPEADGQLVMSVGELVDDLDGLPTMPDLGGMTLRPALRALADHSLDLQIEGSGFLVQQVPAPGVPVREGDHVALFFSADGSAEASD
jgi:cell division protein FtsI (penicillin-binding protein 3)